jgi:hypothetical protein
MRVFRAEGVTSRNFIIPLTNDSAQQVVVILDATDEFVRPNNENRPDAVTLYLVSGALLPPDEEAYWSDTASTYGREIGTVYAGSPEMVVTAVLSFDPEPGEVLVARLASGFGDERSYWKLRVFPDALGTRPLVFEPLNDADSLIAVEGAPDLLTNTGPTLIYHELAPTGILIQAGMLRLDLDARQVTILPHAMAGFTLAGETSGAPITLLEAASFSLDDARIPGHLVDADLPEMLGTAKFHPTDLILDERGAVYEFYLTLPDALGGGTVVPTLPAGGQNVVDLAGDLVGGAIWSWDYQEPPSNTGGPLLLGLLDAGTLQATVGWDELSERLSIRGEIFLSDLFRDGAAVIFDAKGGLFSAPDGDGLDGVLRSNVDLFPAGLPLWIGLELRLVPAAGGFELAARVDMTGFLGATTFVLPEVEAELVYDLAEQAITSLGVTHVGLSIPAQFGGYVLTDFAGGFVHTPADGAASAAQNRFEAEVAFALTDRYSGALLTRMVLDGSGDLEGFGGAFGLELFDTAGNTLFSGGLGAGGSGAGGFLTGQPELYAAIFNGSFTLPVLGSFTAGRITLSQGMGTESQMQVAGLADITLPAELMALFDIEGSVQAQIDGLVTGASAGESFISTIGQLGSSWIGTGEFGVRATLDGQAQLIGGLGFGDADPGAVAARSAGEPGLQRYNLDADAEGLAMRASGPVDAADVVILAPDGTEYRLADFAARGIRVLNDDASGVTLLVPGAEAGEWVLMAAAATGFSGYADLADLSLTISATTVEGAPGLRLEASHPDGLPPNGYDWRIYADADGSGFDGQLVYLSRYNGSDTLAIAFADLGLAPGNWHLHATLGSGALAPISAYLPEPITITGIADLTIKADLIWRDLGEGESAGDDDFPMLHVLLTNEGTATALEPFIATNVPGFERIGLQSLAAGESRVFIFDSLRGLGLTREDGGIVVSTGHRGAEADRTDNTTLAAHDPPRPFQARPESFVEQEDARIWSSVAGNDSGVASVELVAGPLHGTVELAANGVFLYQPDEH